MSRPPPSADFSEQPWLLSLAGDWSDGVLPDMEVAVASLSDASPVPTVDVSAVQVWDPRLSAFLLRLQRAATAEGLTLSIPDAPKAQAQLLRLASAVPKQIDQERSGPPLFSLGQLGAGLTDTVTQFVDSLAFLGESVLAVMRALSGRSAMRRRELLNSCAQAGPNALGIIALTSVLVGMILAYLGAAQLLQFGAAIYVADLVAIGMLREMGALMTAVVMAGRTGAAYAAQLSTMQGNEEIDAIRTLGIDPLEFLVAPRIIALIIMMPLLVVFADALGILGGALVAGGMGVSLLQYVSQLEGAMSLTHFGIGLGKAVLFAALIAIAGCRAGMSAGRNSAAVGKATTDAVVTAVVYLIIADAGVNILCQQLGI